jgi:hypothetical protein
VFSLFYLCLGTQAKACGYLTPLPEKRKSLYIRIAEQMQHLSENAASIVSTQKSVIPASEMRRESFFFSTAISHN